MEALPFQLYFPGSEAHTTIQSAINAAAQPPRGAVWIISSYSGTDSYSNPLGVPIFDMRYPGSISFSSGGGNAALKPVAADGIQYVAPEGSDANDGLSWGSAKLTIMAGFDALPTYGGTVYITSGQSGGNGPAATSIAGQGIWLMGPNDPNYASPPSGWRKMKAGAVSFVGVSGTSIGSGTSVSKPATPIQAGSSATNPSIWLSGVTGVSFSNLQTQYPRYIARVNVTSTGDRTGNVINCSDIVFDNILGSTNTGSAASGPCIDIGGNSLWILIRDCLLEANALATADSAQRAAVFVGVGAGGPATGLVYVEDTHFTGGGGFRFDSTSQTGTGSFYVNNCVMEGAGNSQPVVEVIGAGVLYGSVVNPVVSDSGDSVPYVRVDSRIDPSAIIVSNAQAGIPVEGPCILDNVFTTGNSSNNTLYGISLANTFCSAKRQRGTVQGFNIDQVDAARRTSGPSLARFTINLEGKTQLPGTWLAGTGTGVTITPVAGPDGTLNAGRLTSTADGGGGFSNVYVFDNSTPKNLAAGDYIFVGAWVKPASGNGFTGANFGEVSLDDAFSGTEVLQLISGSAYSSISGNGSIKAGALRLTDGGWQWVWGLARVNKGNASVGYRFSLNFTSAAPIDAYAPVFMQIPASSLAVVSSTSIDTAGNSGATESGNIVTIKTTSNHNLVAGMPIVITGVTAAGYNGGFVVRSTPTATTFTYYNTTTGLSTSGSGTARTVNDTEAAEWARNLVAYPDNVVAGPTVTTMRGVNLSFGGSADNFLALLDHTAFTANRTITFSDNSGTVAILGANQTWSGTQQFNSGKFVLKGSVSGTTTVNADATAGATTATFPPNSGIVAELNYAQSWSAVQTLGSGNLKLAGSTSGSATLNADATAGSAVITLPKTTTTLGGLAQAASWTAAQTFVDAMLLLAGATSGAATLKADATAGSAVLTLPKTTSVLAGLAQTASWTSDQYFNGGIGFSGPVTKTADYTATAADCIIMMNSATNHTITLPVTVSSGKLYRIKNISTGTVTVAGVSGNVDGAANTTLPTQYQAKDLHFDGTNYWVF